MNQKREHHLVNVRWYCDHAIESARLQRERVLKGGASRYDLDFYMLSVWRLTELARHAATNGVPAAGEIRAAMLTRWPLLNEVRNWWIHARPMEWTSWFPESIERLERDGVARAVLHVRHDQEEVEAFYAQLCDALGPLPTDEA